MVNKNEVNTNIRDTMRRTLFGLTNNTAAETAGCKQEELSEISKDTLYFIS
jgi:hypothetical protein